MFVGGLVNSQMPGWQHLAKLIRGAPLPRRDLAKCDLARCDLATCTLSYTDEAIRKVVYIVGQAVVDIDDRMAVDVQLIS